MTRKLTGPRFDAYRRRTHRCAFTATTTPSDPGHRATALFAHAVIMPKTVLAALIGNALHTRPPPRSSKSP